MATAVMACFRCEFQHPQTDSEGLRLSTTVCEPRPGSAPTDHACAFAAMIGPGVWGGHASDRYGRKRFVYAAGAAQILVAAYFIVFYPNQQGIVIALGALYGIGYGLFLAVDWALACDTIPDRAKAAKDMGLFHVAQTLPNSIIPAIEGSLIDTFNKHVAPNSGYRVAFGSVILFFTLGTIFVSRIRSVR